jgi:hypothetical protein
MCVYAGSEGRIAKYPVQVVAEQRQPILTEEQSPIIRHEDRHTKCATGEGFLQIPLVLVFGVPAIEEHLELILL